MLCKMTGDQAKHWHEGWNSPLNAQKLKGRCSWVDQAVENEVNTHWAFGTVGLPTWLLTREDTINDMEVTKSHLYLDYLQEKDKAAKILDELEGELDADLGSTSCQLVSMRVEHHLTAFTEELSSRMAHQPPTV